MLTHRNSYRIRGRQHPNAKLTDVNIGRIRRLLAEGFTVAGIAREYGVSAPTIRAIRDGRTWTHVPSARD